MKPLSPELAAALQAQHTLERTNEAAYLSLAWQMDIAGMSGAQKWLTAQAAEEKNHAEKFAWFMSARNVPAQFEAAGLFVVASDLQAALQAAADREMLTTEAIGNLYAMAESVEDEAACVFLNWFITEQVESEKFLADVLARLINSGGDTLMVDHELGET